MKRSAPMARGASTLRRSWMARGRSRLGPGKQTAENLTSNARLKVRFAALGITSCELFGFLVHDCTRDNYLTWAHGRKRRKLLEGELDTLVILACQNGHNAIEFLQPEEMLAIVQDAIERRGSNAKAM